MELSEQQAADVLKELPRLCRAVQQVCIHTQRQQYAFVSTAHPHHRLLFSLHALHFSLDLRFCALQATNCDGVNVLHNGGAAAGQIVHHLHFHVLPRHAGDGLFSQPQSAKSMITAEEATSVLGKIKANL